MNWPWKTKPWRPWNKVRNQSDLARKIESTICPFCGSDDVWIKRFPESASMCGACQRGWYWDCWVLYAVAKISPLYGAKK